MDTPDEYYLKKEIKELKERLKEFHSVDNGVDINHNEEYDGVYGVAQWVKDCKSRLEIEGGGMFDSGLRCVSEGGQVFYIDPEEIESVIDLFNQLQRYKISYKINDKHCWCAIYPADSGHESRCLKIRNIMGID